MDSMKPVDLFCALGRSERLRPLHRPIGLLMPRLMRRLDRRVICGVVGHAGRSIAAPSCGAPATRLTRTTVRENLTDARVMFETIERAVTTWRLDGDFTFSDLTVEPEACGCAIEMPEDSLPYVLSHPVNTPQDLGALQIPDPLRDGRMPVMVECTRMLAHRFSLLTITGGCGPFTLAGELMGTENAAVSTIERPEFLQQVLEFCLEVNLRYLNALAAAGAECLLIAEPTGAILSPGMFRRFSGVYLKRLVEELPLPVILHVCGDASHLIEEVCATGALGISLDAPVSLAAAARRVGKSTLIIGNLDPVEVFLEMDEGGVRTRTRRVLEEMRGFSCYVAASGCDLSPMTPQGNIKAFVEAVREFR